MSELDRNTGTTEPIHDTGASASHRSPDEHQMQGHWLLARLGKRVLRPGGKALTRRLLAQAAPSSRDRIVEFGPGVGVTAEALLAVDPVDYVAVDPHPQGTPAMNALIAGHPRARLVVSDAADTTLPDGEADLVIGEAMLSMHPDSHKDAVVAEAARILAPGGRYAIHELERIEDERTRGGGAVGGPADPVSKDISRAIKVGARPLTEQGWHDLITRHGLEVVWTGHADMRLLEPSRLIADEGVRGAARFLLNVARNKPARERVLSMRRSFRANRAALGAIAVVAVKPRHREV